MTNCRGIYILKISVVLFNFNGNIQYGLMFQRHAFRKSNNLVNMTSYRHFIKTRSVVFIFFILLSVIYN